MNDVIKKFNIYDHFGYILVGLYQICSLYLLYCLLFGKDILVIVNIFKIDYALALILVSYFVGHFVQAISNFFDKWERKKKEEKKEDLKFITEKAKTFFSLPQEIPQRIVFQYCYLYALAQDISGHVALFNSMYSLYRGAWITSSLNFLISLIAFVGGVIFYFLQKGADGFLSIGLILYVVAMFVLMLIFKRRKNRFFNYMSEKTLITFDIASKDLLNKK